MTYSLEILWTWVQVQVRNSEWVRNHDVSHWNLSQREWVTWVTRTGSALRNFFWMIRRIEWLGIETVSRLLEKPVLAADHALAVTVWLRCKASSVRAIRLGDRDQQCFWSIRPAVYYSICVSSLMWQYYKCAIYRSESLIGLRYPEG
jgi:hypothetical protein